jgi:hypothetical protein
MKRRRPVASSNKTKKDDGDENAMSRRGAAGEEEPMDEQDQERLIEDIRGQVERQQVCTVCVERPFSMDSLLLCPAAHRLRWRPMPLFVAALLFKHQGVPPLTPLLTAMSLLLEPPSLPTHPLALLFSLCFGSISL